MAILPKSGRAAMAAAIKSQSLHLAWGTGDGAWTSPPSEDVDATSLVAEIGRRELLESAFVTEDPEGEIVIDGAGRFTRTPNQTNNLYMQFRFDFSDATTAVIREIGVFVGTVTNPNLPPGKRYFLPSEIVNPGTLLQIENKAPIYRSPSTRETFEILITF